jgi:hypothetical protein
LLLRKASRLLKCKIRHVMLYVSPNIRRMRWAGHVARMGRKIMHIGWMDFVRKKDETNYNVEIKRYNI